MRLTDTTEAIPAGEIELWPCPPTVHSVTFTSAELTALCPASGHPDLYTVDIAYSPLEFTLESKGLKFYLHSFRSVPASAEELCGTIATDLGERLGVAVTVTLTQAVRGGLTERVEAIS